MATTKATSPKSAKQTAAPVAAATAPVSPAAAGAPAGQAAPLFALTAKQPRNGNTKQGAKSGAGKNWHSAPTAHVAPNTRALAYAALQALPSPFTQAAALAALAPVVAGTSGTARSYWAAFVASGYIAPSA